MPPATDVPDDRVYGDDGAASVAEAPPSSAPPPSTAPHWGPPAPHRPTRGGRSRRGWFAVAGVGAALLLGSTGAVSNSATETQTRDFTGSSIVFEAGGNDVEVLGGAAPGKVEIIREYRWGMGASKPSPNESWTGDTLEISDADCNGLSWRCSIDYVVRVPDGTDVTIDSGSGDIVVAGALGTLDLEAGSGDIDGQGLESEKVVVHTGSGDIDLGFAAGEPNVEARAGSGSIDLDLPTAPSALNVRTGSGDVQIDVPETEPFQIDVQTGSGDQDVELADSPDADRLIRVETGSGDVELE
jgi:hypothetical protein